MKKPDKGNDGRGNDGPFPLRLELFPLDFFFVGEVNGIFVAYVFS